MSKNRSNDSSKGTKQLEGHYANYFNVGYNAFEFLIDFSQLYTENQEARTHTRIITSPAYAKDLLKMLQECIEQYEQIYGSIKREEEE
ncbi:MAG: DUF3467 domain-containing protein [bacterium]